MINMHFRSVNFKADKKLKEFAKKRIDKLSLFYNQILEVFVFTKVSHLHLTALFVCLLCKLS